MKKRISVFIFVVLLVYGDLFAAPSITGVSDTTTTDDQSIILTGSGFTTNNNSPSSWNDMESDTIGQVPTDQTIVGTSTGGLVQANLAHSGTKSEEFNYYVDSGSGQADWQRNLIDLGQGEDKIYLTVWIYLDYNESTCIQWQWKSFTITSSPKGYYDLSPVYPADNLPYSAEAYNETTVFMNYWWRLAYQDIPSGEYGWFNNHGQGYYYDNVTDFANKAAMSYTSAPLDALLWNTWQRLEFYAQRASAPATSDGIWWEQRVGKSGRTMDYTNVQTHWDGNNQWRYVTLSSALESVYTGYAELDIYMDDVYVNTSQARVEIGDNSDFDSCTHREIQPFTAWSDTSITLSVNQGAFSDGLVYLFVVDEDGAATTGYPITFAAASSTAPTVDAGTNQSISVNYATANGTYTLEGERTVASCTWSSDNGESGTLTASGGTITGTMSGLAYSTVHTITITVTDSEAESGSDTVQITVGAEPESGSGIITISNSGTVMPISNSGTVITIGN